MWGAESWPLVIPGAGISTGFSSGYVFSVHFHDKSRLPESPWGRDVPTSSVTSWGTLKPFMFGPAALHWLMSAGKAKPHLWFWNSRLPFMRLFCKGGGNKSSIQSFHQVSEEQLFGSKRETEHFIVHLKYQSFYTSCLILASQKWVQVGNLSIFEWESVVRKVKWHSQFSADIKCGIPILNWGAQIPRFAFHAHCRAGFLKRRTS